MRREFLTDIREYKASEILEMAGIDSPPVDLERVLAFLDIRIDDEFDFERMGVSGQISWNDNKDGVNIWINPMDSERRRRFTLSHELGHLFRHMLPNHDNRDAEKFIDHPRSFNRDGRISKTEREANNFSAQLLMPRTMVKSAAKQLADKNRSKSGKIAITKDEFISKLADEFQVSTQAMGFRLKNLNIIK